MKIALVLMTLIIATALACDAGGKMDSTDNAGSPCSWADEAMVGQPVDLAPWAYEWRADRAVQSKPEASFIPRRLDRIDRVYRTAYAALPQEQLRSIYYDMPDLLKPLLPQPKGRLRAGLLWTGGLADYQVELEWPEDQAAPSPETVEVRAYPTSFGWFGWTVDKVLSGPQISADGRRWTYKSDPTAKMDSAYSARVPAATEMVAVFCEGDKQIVPSVHITGPSLGAWKRMDVEIEWGFQPGKGKSLAPRLEPHVAMVGPAEPLADNARRGIVVPLLYAPDARGGLDSRVTIRSGKAAFTFRITDLENAPMLIPEHGAFIAKAGSGQTARRFASELAARNLKGIRQMTEQHREAASWDQLMQEVRLWTCPEGTEVPRFPKVDEPAMKVALSDWRWTDAWRAACAQLRGKHLWGGLAFEVGRVAREMDMVGLHEQADAVYEHFLKGPGAKPDGDYTDGAGALEWATAMRHDMGYNHDGTHASTGRLLFAMAERYFLTGDKEWFERNRARLQAAADWIVRQRSTYMKDVPNRRDLFAAGLMPPCMLGDYAIPSCDWRWYYVDNALSLQGLQRFADALAEFDPRAGAKYHKEAEAFRKDLRQAAEEDAALAPVRLGRDGMYHSFIPRMAYAKGLTGPELGAPQFPESDRFVGALPLAEPFAAMDAGDRRMVDTLDMTEEMGTSPETVQKSAEARKLKGLPADDAWFWNCFVILPKASHNAGIYLLQDDVPSFLRFWMNSYASVVGADGKLWEHWHLGGYTNCDTPDNGTAGWFLENFRNLLVMEDNQSLWIARATPRAWLGQGKRIAVQNAPTYFGTLGYEIISDVDNGKITATIDIPSRHPAKSVIVRFRHPQAKPIKSVTINGEPSPAFSPTKETVELKALTSRVVVVARY